MEDRALRCGHLIWAELRLSSPGLSDEHELHHRPEQKIQPLALKSSLWSHPLREDRPDHPV